MKRSLVERYRIERLNRLIVERTVSRGTAPSKVFQTWAYLTLNGPKTVAELQAELPKTLSSNTAINFCVSNNVLLRNGNIISANPTYNWDDEGVVSPQLQQAKIAIASREATKGMPGHNADIDLDEVEDTPKVINNTVKSAPKTRNNVVNDAPEIQPSTMQRGRRSSVRPNLFSAKLDDVKAAVAEGQDVNTPNGKNVYPLVHACRNAKHDNQGNEIIKYLLEQGADPNRLDGKKHVLFTLIYKGNDEAARMLAEHGADLTTYYKGMLPASYALGSPYFNQESCVYLIPEKAASLSGYYYAIRELIEDTVKLHNASSISDKIYRDILNKICDGVSIEDLDRVITRNIQAKDMSNPNGILCNFYTKLGEMPRSIYTYDYNKEILKKMYSFIKRAAKGELHIRDVKDFLFQCEEVSRAMNAPVDFMFDFITDDFLRDFNDYDALRSIIIKGIQKDRGDLLERIDKNVKDVFSANDMISALASSKVGRKTSIEACDLIKKALKSNRGETHLNRYSVDAARKSKNAYLIDFLLENDFADDLLYGISDPYNSDVLSPEFKKVLKSSGVKIKKWSENDMADQLNRREADRWAAIIAGKILDDEWNTDCERYVNSNPEILNDDRIKDLLDTMNNLTVRQLKRKLASIPKEEDEYDF